MRLELRGILRKRKGAILCERLSCEWRMNVLVEVGGEGGFFTFFYHKMHTVGHANPLKSKHDNPVELRKLNPTFFFHSKNLTT